MQTGDQEKVRKINKSIVLDTLRLYAPISRARVANLTGLNRGTVSNIVNDLIAEGLVAENEQEVTRVGRPEIALSLRPDGGAVIGVEIGVDFIAIILTNFIAEILWRVRVEIQPAQSQTEIIGQAEKLIEEALEIARDKQLRPLGIGIGLPGLVNIRQGELIFAPNLNWKSVPIRLMWNQRFHLPIYADNEANLAALGEYYFGVARGVDDFVYLSSGIGLGGGIVIGGKLFRGGRGYGGEIGHIQREPNGEPCACGRVGCWETQVGPRAVLRRIQKEFHNHPDAALLDACQGDIRLLTFERVVELALGGNATCRTAIEEVAFNLGVGIADLVNIFNPNLIVVGGAFILGKAILQPIIETTAYSMMLLPSRDYLQIKFSDLGADACVLGAVAVVLDDILREMTIV
jgi:glucokinase-like ROK family protein